MYIMLATVCNCRIETSGNMQNLMVEDKMQLGTKKLPTGVGKWALIQYCLYVCGIVQMDRRAA